MIRAAAVAAAALALALEPTAAEAHAFGARYDLPLPLGLYLVAAGAAVAGSFLGVLAFLRAGWTSGLHVDLPLPRRLAATLTAALGTAGIMVLATLLGAAFFGPTDAMDNLATIGIWVLWWVGFLLFSALALSVWAWVDPFRTLARGAARLAGRPWEGGSGPPTWAGYLAPAGLLGLAWVELVSERSEDPRALGAAVAVYAAGSIAAGMAFGRRWFEVADPLGRVFEAVGRVAPLALIPPATLRLRPPGEGLLSAAPRARGEVLLVACLIGAVLFDGLSETPTWRAVLDWVSNSRMLRPALLDLHARGVDLMKAIRTIGMFAVVAAFLVSYRLLIAAMRAMAGGDPTAGRLASAFAGVLLPIAIAYHLSHYLSYLLFAGQLALPALSDPFGLGWDLFGTRSRALDIGVIGAEGVWWTAFAAVISGHALSVIVGHRRALQIFRDARRAARSQVPMTAAMVGLTVLSLWILSQPITE